ncbi:DgyrCDS11671 [Dimorphilus gyrociliatus]|uniref:DgyrCDS11671 n=1 Tax=Dimorphilus gyrociliatus TaxID=2664684 RepID=A0A7I8W545_9ANNE|nr:DgyrCDS11671 [Dimorphilus gyrociliatus]
MTEQDDSRTPTIFRNPSSTLSTSMRTMCMTQDPDLRAESVKDLLALLKKGEDEQLSKYSSTLVGLLFELNHKEGFQGLEKELAQCSGLVGYYLREKVFLYINLWKSKVRASQMARDLIHLVDAIKELLRADVDTRYLEIENSQQNNVDDICKTISTMVTTTTDEIVFCKCAKVFSIFTKVYPDTMEKYFKEVAEAAINWSRNIESKSFIVEKANELISCFTPFWSKDLEFSFATIKKLIHELNELEQKYYTSQKSDNTIKQCEIKDEMICAFCIYGILLDCIGRLIPDSELSEFLIADSVLEAIMNGSTTEEGLFKIDVGIENEGEKHAQGNDNVTLSEQTSCSAETQNEKRVSIEIEATVEEIVEMPFIKLVTMESDPVSEV